MHPDSIGAQAREDHQNQLALLAVKGDEQARQELYRSIADDCGEAGGAKDVFRFVLDLASSGLLDKHYSVK